MSRIESLLLAVCALIAFSTVIFVHLPDGHADTPDPDDIAHMKFGHTKVEGVVTQKKSGLYTVKTATGTNYTLAESVAVRYGREVPQVGDHMILWINEGNHVMDAGKKGVHTLSPHFISGKLISINYGTSHMKLSTPEGEKALKLRPENQMFADIAVGTPVTIAMNEAGEVIDIHVEKDSDVPRSGLSHPENESALKGFRHLGKPE